MRLECSNCGVEEDLVVTEYNQYGNYPVYCSTCLELLGEESEKDN